jgi:hypothetical protein
MILMRAAVRRYCEESEDCYNFVKLEAWRRSKIFQKFFHFIKMECEDNLNGFLMAILFLSNNKRIEKARHVIKKFLDNGLFVSENCSFSLV